MSTSSPLSHSIKSTNHSFIQLRFSLLPHHFFHFHFPSSENVFYWNLFCDNIFISFAFSPFNIILLAMVVNGFFFDVEVLFRFLLRSDSEWIKTSQKWCFFFTLHSLTMSLSKNLKHSVFLVEHWNLLTQLFLPIFTIALFSVQGWGVEIYQFIHTQMNKYFYENRRLWKQT